MVKRVAMGLIILIAAAGCASRPPVWKEAAVNFKDYRVLAVPPVSDETGKTHHFDVPETLTLKIREQLRDKGFTVMERAEANGNTLMVKCALVAYEPGSALARWVLPGLGPTKCTVTVSLVDQETGKPVSEFVATETVAGGGLFSVGADRWILGTVSKKITGEINHLLKGE